MIEHDWQQFDVLRTLVSELRGRLPNLTKGQFDAVGEYMLKAMWLGQGEPVGLVLGQWANKPKEKPALRVVGGGRE